MDGKILYKAELHPPLLWCISKAQAQYVMQEIHEVVRRNHYGARMLARKALRAGYYWPSMVNDSEKDSIETPKMPRVLSCAALPALRANTVASLWSFAQWRVDIVGPLLPRKGKVKFIVVAINYFIKWMEAKSLATITKKAIEKLLWCLIVCHFGIPHVIVTDNEKQFDNKPFLRLVCTTRNNS